MAEQDDGVHRLSDFLVEEVSLVDRAANKRRFLLVKREGDMSELRSNGRGGFERVSKAEGADEEDATEKAKKKPAFPGAKPAFGKPAAGGEDDEEKRKKADGEDDEDETSKADEAETADGEGDDEEKRKKGAFSNGDEKKRRAKAILGDLTGAIELCMKAAEDMKDEEGEPSDKAVKSLKSAHAALSATLEKVEKGASTKRAEFMKGADGVQSLLRDLMNSKGHDPAAGDPQKAAAGFSAKNPSAAETATPGTMKAIAKMVDELVGMVKDATSQTKKLRKGVPGSNSIPVEKSASKGGGSDKTSWPLDMNRPIDRSKVDKSVSFIDD